MARPKNIEASITVEIQVSPKLLAYLDRLKELDGYGASRPEIIRNFAWKEINRLIEAGRLTQLP